jgi:lipoate-protein ligase A
VETWRLITTWRASPAFNMALDSALLESQGAPPTLRFYTWRPEALSLGYFQRIADVPAAKDARSVVRRITGGGAIHHANELTFSLAASADHPLYAGPIGASYERIHRAIASALRELGVEATLRGDSALASDRAGTGMCFHDSTPLDLVWNERKGVGSAQRRKRGRVLHHGSIKLDTSPLEGDIATLAAAAPRTTAEMLAPRIRAAFERELGLTFEASVPDFDEQQRTRELEKHFLDPAFVRRR